LSEVIAMIIKKIVESPFRKYVVKNLPKDAKYRQYDVNGNEVYYSEIKKSYYVVIV
jgi:hypothetical protein